MLGKACNKKYPVPVLKYSKKKDESSDNFSALIKPTECKCQHTKWRLTAFCGTATLDNLYHGWRTFSKSFKMMSNNIPISLKSQQDEHEKPSKFVVIQ